MKWVLLVIFKAVELGLFIFVPYWAGRLVFWLGGVGVPSGTAQRLAAWSVGLAVITLCPAILVFLHLLAAEVVPWLMQANLQLIETIF